MEIIDGSLLSEQRRELANAIAVENDLEFAISLQIQEAINASLTTTKPSKKKPSKNKTIITEVTESPPGIAHAALAEIDSLKRVLKDRKLVEKEMKKTREDVNIRLHDQAFAKKLMNVPDKEWRKKGDLIEKPFKKGVEMSEEVFRVYYKGIVSEESVGKIGRVRVEGIGVAICDTLDSCVFEVEKAVIATVVNGDDILELKAVIEGLSVAVSLGLKRIRVFCDTDDVYGYLTGKRQPTNNTTVTLVDQLNLIQTKFASCGAYLVRQNDIMFAIKLARDAITSQVTQLAENASGKRLFKKCKICFDSIYSGQMFCVDKCLHKYCFSCMGKHMEAKLLQAQLPECPHEGCKSHLEIERCKKFLNQEQYDIMSLRIREASIPPTEKVYCPFSSCSALMSKSEVKEYTATSSAAAHGMRECVKCRRLFCVKCKVPWHDNLTCSEYKRKYPDGSASEAKLKSLATRNNWRQCIKCKNMVELAAGCYHISCRCGYEFCYICGAKWSKKKATCNCLIWDEQYIINDGH